MSTRNRCYTFNELRRKRNVLPWAGKAPQTTYRFIRRIALECTGTPLYLLLVTINFYYYINP